MSGLRVVASGARTLVQDLGFRGGRGQGVPASGVMDRPALELVNALLGNPAGTEALEAVLTAPVLRAEGGPVRVALGGSFGAVVRAPDGGERRVAPWTATTLAEGDLLVPDAPARGAYGLIAVAGGFDLPRVLGSRATLLAAGFGGLDGRALVAGDRLAVAGGPPVEGPDRRVTVPPPVSGGPLRCVPGPQAEWFGAEGLAVLTGTDWTVGRETDRMGMRLDGPAIPFAPGRSADILSDGIVPGAVQVPGSGRPIVLLADAQTTGGYAKIATVIGADLPRLAALASGDRLRLATVSVAEAEAAWHAARRALAAAIGSIRDIAGGPPPPERLFSQNLIGGMIDMDRPDHFEGHLGLPGKEPPT